MHHFLSRPDWLEDLNLDLAKLGVKREIPFADFVLVENDWLSGREPEDVAAKIAAGDHGHVHLHATDIETSTGNG